MEFGGSVHFKKGSKMRILFLTITVFSLIVTNAFSFDFLYHSDGPYRGKVVDLETGEPIEGAVVAAVWTLTHRFCDAKETVTDKNGEFILPKGWCFSFWPFTEIDYPEVVVFKPGYLGYEPLGSTFEEKKARMPGFTGHEFQNKKEYNIIRLGRPKTRMERELTQSHAQIFTDECYDKLPILLKMINEERRNLGLDETGRPASGKGRSEK
jgi:hypothetical protein